MAYQPKSYKKFVATAATATLVASAIAPVASAAFSDVAEQYKTAVDYLSTKGISQGYPNGKFGTDDKIKRQDAAVMIAKALGASPTGTYANAGFTDVPKDRQWAVNFLVEKKIVSGKTAEKFGANDFTTRGEMSKIIANAYKFVGDATNAFPFTDVSDTFKQYVDALNEAGVAKGLTATKFGTGDQVTRGQFALFVYRAETFVPATPTVVSVSAINAKKFEVKFNTEVNKAAAEAPANYTFVGLKNAAGNAITASTYELQADNKTVVITLSDALANDTTLVATVSEIATKADANVKTAKFTKTLTFADNVRPAFNSVVYPKPGVAELNFSEELSTEGSVVVYDGLVASTTVTKSLAGSTLTLGALELNKEYKVVITGAKDQSGNLIANPIEVTVKNTSSDTAKPVANSISTQGLDTVKVQFSEAVVATAPGVYATIAVNGTPAAGVTQNFDAKTNVLTVSGIAGIVNGDVKSITVDGFKDAANLNGVAVTKVLSFTTAAPALQSTTVVTEGAKTFAVLTFDKAVSAVDANFTASYVTADNIYKTTTLPATVDTDKKQVKLEVTGKDAGAYTVVFAADKLSDGVTGNAKAIEVKFNVGTSVDSTTPEVSALFLAGDTLPDGVTKVPAGTAYVKYSKPMSASALNADNYKVDGSSVFSNPIFIGDKTLVKLTIKSGVVTVSGDRNFSVSTAVKGENNVAIKPFTVVDNFKENVSPVLTTASLVDDATIELSLSELLGTTGFDAADAAKSFEVTVAGNKNVVTAVTDVTAGDNKVRLTITNKITADQLANSTITVKALDTALVSDLVGNVVTANTTVNVAK